MTPIRMTMIAAVAACAYAGTGLAADTMPKDQYKTEKQRIEADGKSAREKCKGMSANAKDVCMAEAKGNEKVAKAELEAKQKDTAKARYDLAVAKSDMTYNVAKEKCDDLKGNDNKACTKDAKAAHDQAKKQARADRDGADGKKDRTAKSSK